MEMEIMNNLLKSNFWNDVILLDDIEKGIEKKLQTAQMSMEKIGKVRHR